MSRAAHQRQSYTASHQCEVCGCAIRIKPTGRPRRYCSNKCRQKAARVRSIVTLMVEIEQLKNEFNAEAKIDWSDESHRVT